MKNFIKLSIITTLSLNQFAFGAGNINTTQQIASMLGTQDAIDATPSCNLDLMSGGDAGGNLGVINMVPCLLNLQAGIKGATGATGVTKTLTFGKKTFKAHIVVLDTPVTVDGTKYDYETKIWTCTGTCASATNYFPSIWMAFSANGAKTINEGVMANNFDADSGNFIGSSFMKWNSGDGEAKKIIKSVHGECRDDDSFDTHFMDYQRVVASGVAKLSTIAGNHASANKYASLVIDINNNVGYLADDIAQSSVLSFTRTAATVAVDGENRSDFTYAQGGTYTAAFLDLPTFNLGSFASVTCTDGAVSAGKTNGGVTGITKGVGVLATPLTSAMNGMTLNPDNI